MTENHVFLLYHHIKNLKTLKSPTLISKCKNYCLHHVHWPSGSHSSGTSVIILYIFTKCSNHALIFYYQNIIPLSIIFIFFPYICTVFNNKLVSLQPLLSEYAPRPLQCFVLMAKSSILIYACNGSGTKKHDLPCVCKQY